MKILGYDEVDKQQVIELNMACFRWMLTPELAEEIRKVDKHCPDYFAIHAVEKDEILSQVGFITLDTETIEGIESIGFIWGVCTKPSAASKGAARALMIEAHRRLLDEGVRYSFLGTGKSLIAYDLYRKLGYMDFSWDNSGIKRCREIQRTRSDLTFSSTSRNKPYFEIFEEYSKDLLGFTHRPKNFLKVRKAWSWMPVDLTGIFLRDEKPIGYMIGSREGKIIKILELCCPDIKEMKTCIKALESKFRPEYLTFSWTSRSKVVDSYLKFGFSQIGRTWGIFMIADLKGKDKIGRFRSLYGIDDDRFQMTAVDEY